MVLVNFLVHSVFESLAAGNISCSVVDEFRTYIRASWVSLSVNAGYTCTRIEAAPRESRIGSCAVPRPL